MDARQILGKLRSKEALTPEDVTWFARGLASDAVNDAQAGAFAMGVCRSPLSVAARVALTTAMGESGKTLRWDLPGPVLDKHSTGGIGDAVSLLLVPAMAALGAFVPMISGRGLGHSGGTLDKIEAIPGVTAEVDVEKFRRIVQETGCAIVAASTDIAPADRRLYGVRDATSTVESIDLITASILSKKLAGGINNLVLDVKVGSGAFMTTMPQALTLARSLVETANAAGTRATALITDMNQPTAAAMGNALEIIEVMTALTDGGRSSRLADLTVALGGELARLAGLADDRGEGAEMVRGVLVSGAAAERFGRMVASMGGPRDFVDRWRDRLPSAPAVKVIPAPRAGYLTSMDGKMLGGAVVRLGGGRLHMGDRVDPSVGLSDFVSLGDRVALGDPLAIVHAANDEQANAAVAVCSRAFKISDTAPDLPDLILQEVT